jgi:hypothetical protein
MPIEAKFIFPLDDKAAVCGFEAFINEKHIVGEVRESALRLVVLSQSASPLPSLHLLTPMGED